MKATLLITTFGLFIATGFPPTLHAASDSGIGATPPENNENQTNPFPKLPMCQ